MRIARFTHEARTRLGLVLGDEIADIGTADAALPADLNISLSTEFLAHLARLRDEAVKVPIDEVRLEPPVASPPVFLGIGLNYLDHVAESAMDKPDAPIVFNKQVTCVAGPFNPIVVPNAAPEHVDYEGELGIVIGARCRAVPAPRALDVVGGWVVVNDVSVRDWQRATPTMTMGKSWDTHGPIGPWLVTTDEIDDPQQLRIRTWVDDDLRQDASTAQMIHSCAELIEHISTAFTLLPGTVIATGTPAGVGFAMDPPAMLHPGSRVRVDIEGIGAIENPVVAEDDVRDALDYERDLERTR